MNDISNFNNVSDYLPILNGSIFADIVVILLVVVGLIQSKNLKKWYTYLNLSACILDILVLVIGIVIARYICTKFSLKLNLFQFTGLVVLIQVVHDVIFYLLFQNVRNSFIFNIFKDYAKEVGAWAIISDSIMIAFATLLSSYLAGWSFNANIIVLIIGIYILPYLIYYNLL